MPTATTELWWIALSLSVLITGFAAVHMIRAHLQRTYPTVVLYLLLDGSANAVVLYVSVCHIHAIQCYLFAGSAYVYPLLYFLLCPDVFRQLFADYPGLLPARRGRIISLRFAAAGAAIFCGCVAILDWANIMRCKPSIPVQLQYLTSFGCGVLIVGIFVWVLKMPVILPLNTRYIAQSVSAQLIGSALIGLLALRYALRCDAKTVDALNILQAFLAISARAQLFRTLETTETVRIVSESERQAAKAKIARFHGRLLRRGKQLQTGESLKPE